MVGTVCDRPLLLNKTVKRCYRYFPTKTARIAFAFRACQHPPQNRPDSLRTPGSVNGRAGRARERPGPVMMSRRRG